MALVTSPPFQIDTDFGYLKYRILVEFYDLQVNLRSFHSFSHFFITKFMNPPQKSVLSRNTFFHHLITDRYRTF